MNVYVFDKPKLQPIFEAFVSSNCDFQQLPASIQRPMRLYIYEIIPQVYISDGFSFIEAVFTKDSINDFRKNFNHMKFSHLRTKLIYVSKWSLQILHRNSRDCYASYNNICIILHIEQFKPMFHEVPALRQINSVDSMFKNETVRTYINRMRHDFIQSIIDPPPMEQDEEMIDETSQYQIDIPQMSDIFAQPMDTYSSEQILGINTFRSGLYGPETLNGPLDDLDDFEEFKLQFNDQQDNFNIDNLANIQKMIKQERGEEKYYELYAKRYQVMKNKLDDEFYRKDIENSMNTQTKKGKIAHDEHERNIKERSKHVKKESIKPRIVKYKMRTNVPELKQRLLVFMKDFKTDSVGDSILQEREIVTRPRSMSQGHLRPDEQKDEGMLLETSSVRGAQALSQYNFQNQSEMDDDETESEPDEMEEEARAETTKLLSQVAPKVSLFKKYLKWYMKYDTTDKSKLESIKKQKEDEQRIIQAKIDENNRIMKKIKDEEERKIKMEQEKIMARQLKNEQKRQEKLLKRQEEQKRLQEELEAQIEEQNKIKEHQQQQEKLQQQKEEADRLAEEQRQREIQEEQQRKQKEAEELERQRVLQEQLEKQRLADIEALKAQQQAQEAERRELERQQEEQLRELERLEQQKRESELREQQRLQALQAQREEEQRLQELKRKQLEERATQRALEEQRLLRQQQEKQEQQQRIMREKFLEEQRRQLFQREEDQKKQEIPPSSSVNDSNTIQANLVKPSTTKEVTLDDMLDDEAPTAPTKTVSQPTNSMQNSSFATDSAPVSQVSNQVAVTQQQNKRQDQLGRSQEKKHLEYYRQRAQKTKLLKEKVKGLNRNVVQAPKTETKMEELKHTSGFVIQHQVEKNVHENQLSTKRLLDQSPQTSEEDNYLQLRDCKEYIYKSDAQKGTPLQNNSSISPSQEDEAPQTSEFSLNKKAQEDLRYMSGYGGPTKRARHF